MIGMGGGGNPQIDQLMALAAMQGGGGGGGMEPGGPPMGPGTPPGMQQGGPRPPGAGGPQQPKPQEMIQAGLLALHIGLSMLGLNETSMKLIHLVQKSIERLDKMMPEGREGAVQQASLPSAAPPGVGGMPGMPMV